MKHKNQTSNTETVFIVDTCIHNNKEATNNVLTELSCGHIVEGRLQVGDTCPKCEKQIVNGKYEKRKRASRIVLIVLTVFTVFLTIVLLRPVSFDYITNGMSYQVSDAQKEQINNYCTISYHTPGFTWLKATLAGKWPHYSAEQFSLRPGATQAMYDNSGNILFYVTTSNELDGIVAIMFANTNNKAYIYEVY